MLRLHMQSLISVLCAYTFINYMAEASSQVLHYFFCNFYISILEIFSFSCAYVLCKIVLIWILDFKCSYTGSE